MSSCGIWINKEKQIKSVSIFNTYIGNTDRTLTLPNYKTLWSSWSKFTGNQIPAPKTLAEIYNEPIYFNPKSDGRNNPSMFLNITTPVSAKGLFITIKDLRNVRLRDFITADEFIKSRTPFFHRKEHGKKRTLPRDNAKIFTVIYTKER